MKAQYLSVDVEGGVAFKLVDVTRAVELAAMADRLVAAASPLASSMEAATRAAIASGSVALATRSALRTNADATNALVLAVSALHDALRELVNSLS